MAVLPVMGQSVKDSQQAFNVDDSCEALVRRMIDMAKASGTDLDTVELRNHMHKIYAGRASANGEYKDVDEYVNMNARQREEKGTREAERLFRIYTGGDLYSSEDEKQRDINDDIRFQQEEEKRIHAELDSILVNSRDTLLDDFEEERERVRNINSVGDVDIDSLGVYGYAPDGSLYHIARSYHNNTGMKPGLFRHTIQSVIDGGASKNTFKGEARFRLYFSSNWNSISDEDRAFNGGYKINDFVVKKMTPYTDIRGKAIRYYVVCKLDPLRGTMGSAKTSDKGIDVKVTKVRDGVYDMTVKAAPGEYCITYNDKDADFYVKNAATMDPYDFSIK